MTSVVGDKPNQPVRSGAELEAVQFGIDLDLIEYNLRLSYDERIRQHENALALVLELARARDARCSGS